MTTNNHPAHGPVSLDRLHQIHETLSKASAQSDGGNLGYAMADAVKVIDGAIAAFGAEPVAVNDDMAYTFHHALSDSSLGADEVEEIKIGLRAAFANIAAQQPAPVVPLPDVVSVLLNHLEDVLPDDAFNLIDVKAWNAVSMLTCPDACRSAMLQAVNHTEQRLDMVDHSGDTNKKGRDGALINEGAIPDTRFQQVADLYGITSPTGSETSFTFDAFEASNFAKGGWSVQEYIELERYQKAVAGNSPVIQDGYVLVPKKLTADNGAKGVLSGEFSETKFINCPECFGDDECETCDGSGRIEITVPVTWTTIKAIWAKGVEHFAAAPQQEVKNV